MNITRWDYVIFFFFYFISANISNLFGAKLFQPKDNYSVNDASSLITISHQSALMAAMIVLRQLIFKGRPKIRKNSIASTSIASLNSTVRSPDKFINNVQLSPKLNSNQLSPKLTSVQLSPKSSPKMTNVQLSPKASPKMTNVQLSPKIDSKAFHRKESIASENPRSGHLIKQNSSPEQQVSTFSGLSQHTIKTSSTRRSTYADFSNKKDTTNEPVFDVGIARPAPRKSTWQRFRNSISLSSISKPKPKEVNPLMNSKQLILNNLDEITSLNLSPDLFSLSLPRKEKNEGSDLPEAHSNRKKSLFDKRVHRKSRSLTSVFLFFFYSFSI